MNYEIYNNKIKLIKADITTLKVDAIVNAANSGLLGGGGVDGAIHKAGGHKIHEECMKFRNKKGRCHTGEAAITTGGKLKAKYVIHTVGPMWNGGYNNEEELLGKCYENSINLAVENEVRTIAFPNISTGVYGFPKKLAAEIALKKILEVMKTNKNIDQIIFVCFDDENYNIYHEMMRGIQ
ncbi:putative phosphatase, C-terminal domain of histone macro H2A1 like protein [Clostridium pasteurianum BC1]|uniref:Putative phosphatase, C-terminal domain of histone macro H2A1 like protein n=1 Tax=Clostridium pasteurianum BC1 TaxID=86416 RepID=R4KAC8_CLOPA|nr:O-acetyl-ADP-ribose deacetylase [Clostridium pasteurianum]AGK96585.1 putative phosphatase, C-terminal domain of histone macro H2A1 like protein [Clostridium pasteurianum BC1]